MSLTNFFADAFVNPVNFVQDDNFVNQLELAVRFGKTLVVQEVDNIEPVLYPLLRGDLSSQGEHCRHTSIVDLFSGDCQCPTFSKF